MWLLPAFSPVARFATRSFYRLHIVGPEVPPSGPVMLMANHPNSLLDPALVVAAAGRPVRFLAKSTLFTDPRVGWLVRASGAIPVYRRSDDPEASRHNVDMFESVFSELASGAAVGIFPEGISHSEPALVKLKTGSARIALGARSAYGSTFPLIPVGLVLRDKGGYRSEALVIRGTPVEWDDLAGRSPEDQQAVRELTARLTEALRAVTVNLERWEDRPLIEFARDVWSTEIAGGGTEIENVRRAQAAASMLADLRRRGDASWVDLVRDVQRHRRRLLRLGLSPTTLNSQVDLAAGALWTLRRLPLLGPPLAATAIIGAVVFWAPYQITDRFVASLQPADDQRSTYKLLWGVLVHLGWIVLLTLASGWLWGGWAALTAAILLPISGLAGLWVRERWRGAWSDARRYLLLRSRRDLRLQLQGEQRALARRLHDAFEEWRGGKDGLM